MGEHPIRQTTLRRHKLVFINYIKVIKRLGKDAKNMSKNSLYDEAGEPLGLDAMTSGRIIRAALKRSNASMMNILNAQEADELLATILELNKE